MVLKILLVISILLQMLAALTAIRLTRVTRYNFSWILFTIALTIMSVLRFGEFIQITGARDLRLPADFFVWLGVLTSLCFAVGVFYVKKIFTYVERLNQQRRLTEKRILNTILRTEEKERLRFSKELHDGLGPLLSSARMSLSALKKTELTGNEKEIIDNTGYVIEEAIRSLREISNNLSPHILNDFGLGRGVSNFINKLPPGKMKIHFTTNLKNERFDTDVEVILYRVICELINNSVKHSGGTDMHLNLIYYNGILSVDYKDNGTGFNPGAMMDVGMGLSNITTRVSSIKGVAEITSAKNKGMRAYITVDLNKDHGRKKI